MFSAGTGNASRRNFATFSGVIPQHSGVFVIDHDTAVSTKPADLSSVISRSASIECHGPPLDPVLRPHPGQFPLSQGPVLPFSQALLVPL